MTNKKGKYGCIVANYDDGAVIIADGKYDELEGLARIVKELIDGTDVRLVEIDESEVEALIGNAEYANEKFREIFS